MKCCWFGIGKLEIIGIWLIKKSGRIFFFEKLWISTEQIIANYIEKYNENEVENPLVYRRMGWIYHGNLSIFDACEVK